MPFHTWSQLDGSSYERKLGNFNDAHGPGLPQPPNIKSGAFVGYPAAIPDSQVEYPTIDPSVEYIAHVNPDGTVDVAQYTQAELDSIAAREVEDIQRTADREVINNAFDQLQQIIDLQAPVNESNQLIMQKLFAKAIRRFAKDLGYRPS